MMQLLDMRVCALGEGPLWHPLQQRWYWFDIVNSRLLGRDDQATYAWQFDEMVSAAGWLDAEHLLVASETQLFKFHMDSGRQEQVVALESSNTITRSNDGRADPWGGFWIGTMGKNVEPGAGAIYRYYQGQLECLFSDITISNAICFSHDKRFAYFTDSPSRQIKRQALDKNGWPTGLPDVHIDLSATDLNPDGAVVDKQGYLWNAQWGAARIARYSPQGEFDLALDCGATQVSCPAFGGVDMNLLMATTAAEGLGPEDPDAGRCFVADSAYVGHPEYQVKL